MFLIRSIGRIIKRYLGIEPPAASKIDILPECISHCRMKVQFSDIGKELILESGPGIPLQFLIYEIIEKKVYFPVGFPMFLDSTNATTIDIGANVGVFTIFLSHLTKGKVLAFEPFPANYANLHNNLALNNVENVRPMKLGVDAIEGQRMLLITPEALSGCRFPTDTDLKSVTQERLVPITCCTFKGILLSESVQLGTQPVLVKMDCEGAEYGILESLDDDTLSMINMLTIEYHDNVGRGSSKAVQKRLSRLKFTTMRTVDVRNPRLGMLVAWRPETIFRSWT